MSRQNNTEQFQRATRNLRKVAIFLLLIGLIAACFAWVRFTSDPETMMQEAVWVLRLLSVAILYASLKCFLIQRCLRPAQALLPVASMDSAEPDGGGAASHSQG